MRSLRYTNQHREITMKSTNQDKQVPVLIRMPAPLARKLAQVAKAEGRSRNMEACRRIAESLGVRVAPAK
jgi:hypothetical protein